MTLRAPFPAFGSKRHAAHLIWQALGDVGSYCEPFCFSAATLLMRPGGAGRIETINDISGHVANFWRSVREKPEDEAWIVKGTRVRVSRLVADLRTCLAGVQMKQSCAAEDWVGTVTHVYGDHPTHPKRVWFMVLPDGATVEVEVERQHIVGVLHA